MPSLSWCPDDIGDLTGRVALVTGANSGIGFETTRMLADHGAHVVMACRSAQRGRLAADDLENDLDRSSIELLTLDLSDLASVRRAAKQFVAEHARLDILINNAGVMATPYRQTADGFELQMATNHFGHFAFTGLLLPLLLMSDRSRVVTVSSLMHRMGHIDFDDPSGQRIANTWQHYGTSKLANLLFTAELARRLQADGETSLAVAAHPGWTRSNLVGAGATLGRGRVRAKVSRTIGHHLGQSTAVGAWPVVYAATAPEVRSGQFIGPSHALELFGPPRVVRPSAAARNQAHASRLWELSEELTGVTYPVGAEA